MVQIINDPGRAGLFGQALGTGLSSGLQQLANHKINELLEQKRMSKASKGLEALGYSPEEAQNYSAFGPEILKQFVKNKLEEPNRQNYGQQVANALAGRDIDYSAIKPEHGIELGRLRLQQQEADQRRLEKQEKMDYERDLKRTLREDKIRAKYSTEIDSLNKLRNYLLSAQRYNESGNLSRGFAVPFVSGKTPGFYNQDTQDYNTIANEIVTEKSQLLKGNPNLRRFEALEKGKISLNKGQDADRRNIQRMLDEVDTVLKKRYSDYPFLREKPSQAGFDSESAPSSQNQQNQSMDLKTFIGPAVEDENGQYYEWNDATKQYEPR